MNNTDSIDIAQRRLALALDALEAAAERRHEADRDQAALADQIDALGNDRARLAGELDEESAHSRALEAAVQEVKERIDGAIATVRGVLAAEDGGNS